MKELRLSWIQTKPSVFVLLTLPVFSWNFVLFRKGEIVSRNAAEQAGIGFQQLEIRPRKSKILQKKWQIKISLRCWPIWPRFLWHGRSAVKFSFEWCKNYPNPTTHIEDIFDFHLFFHRAYRFFPISKNKNGFGVDLSIGLHQKSYFWKRKNSPETGYQLKIAESWFWFFRAGIFREIRRCKISDFGSTTSPNRFFE